MKRCEKKPDPGGEQKGSLLQIMKCNWIIVAYIIIAVAHWSMITAVSITLRVKKAGLTYYCRVRKPCHFSSRNQTIKLLKIDLYVSPGLKYQTSLPLNFSRQLNDIDKSNFNFTFHLQFHYNITFRQYNI